MENIMAYNLDEFERNEDLSCNDSSVCSEWHESCRVSHGLAVKFWNAERSLPSKSHLLFRLDCSYHMLQSPIWSVVLFQLSISEFLIGWFCLKPRKFWSFGREKADLNLATLPN